MKIAVIQLCSKLDYKENLSKIDTFIKSAKIEAPDLLSVFLPEVFYSMSNGDAPTPYLVEMGNEHYKNIQKIALDHQIYLLGGSAATKHDGKIFNRAYNFSPSGEDLGFYDKRCLFSLKLNDHNQNSLDEARIYTAGSKSKIIEVQNFKIAMSICFDLRFPEIYRDYLNHGANILSISSAFTASTGKAHWKTLVRARAIENQSYVVAANQWGVHNNKMSTFGHSTIIDPWGEILVDCKEGESYAIANLELSRVDQIRSRMNVIPIT